MGSCLTWSAFFNFIVDTDSILLQESSLFTYCAKHLEAVHSQHGQYQVKIGSFLRRNHRHTHKQIYSMYVAITFHWRVLKGKNVNKATWGQ